eukprot:14105681-Alexandrium_andersonii.AAC.1
MTLPISPVASASRSAPGCSTLSSWSGPRSTCSAGVSPFVMPSCTSRSWNDSEFWATILRWHCLQGVVYDTHFIGQPFKE